MSNRALRRKIFRHWLKLNGFQRIPKFAKASDKLWWFRANKLTFLEDMQALVKEHADELPT